MELEHKDITEQIIGAAYEVDRELGYGFLEKVYQRAMKVELELRGLKAEIENEIKVKYKGEVSAITARICWSMVACSLNSRWRRNSTIVIRHKS